MTLHKIRYQLEHRILPRSFYEGKDEFVSLLINDENILYKTFDRMCREMDFENPYTPAQFCIDPIIVEKVIYVLQITFPHPETEPLCYYCYLFFCLDFKKLHYFCIERGNEWGNYIPFLCSWSEDRAHNNYGDASRDDEENLHRCVDIYKHMFREDTGDGR